MTGLKAQSLGLMALQLLALSAVSRPAFAQKLPDGAGKDTFVAVCSLCHTAATVMGKQWTKPQWDAKVSEMLQEEPDVTTAERTAIVEYLSAHFTPGGKIYVNDADAADLAALLDISADAAGAIAKYRDAHGRFTSADAIAKVPGVDEGAATKIAAKKDRLEY